MKNRNIVFVAKSLDGYIAGINGELDWLNLIPNPENNDMGYNSLMDEVDAIVMGRTTFETVSGFDGEWPYKKHVFVLSGSLGEIPKKLIEKVSILNGTPKEILSKIYKKGHHSLYIDGGKTVQHFLKEDLIDELRISTIPILLGDGISLFGQLPKSLQFKHLNTVVLLNQIVQSHYKRNK